MSERKTVAELKAMVKEEMQKVYPDDWEDRFDELPLWKVKKPWLAKLNELNRAKFPEQHAHMDACQLEDDVKNADHKSKALAHDLHKEKELTKAAEDRAKACEAQSKDFRDQLNEAWKECDKLRDQVRLGKRSREEDEDEVEDADADEDKDAVLKGALEEIKRLKATGGAHAGSMVLDLKKKNEDNKKLQEENGKLRQELETLRARDARVRTKDDVYTLMHKFSFELHDIANIQLDLKGYADIKDFCTLLSLKVRELDYDDMKFSYVTLNSRLILEKVLVDTMLYERMLQALGVEKGKWVHHKPRADHTARNEHTLAKMKEIWGDNGFNPNAHYNVVGN